MNDEFEIRATSPNKPERIWLRRTLGLAKVIADQAVDTLGYNKAVVTNVFGGHTSDPLYVIENR